jgi:hypothetical protein
LTSRRRALDHPDRYVNVQIVEYLRAFLAGARAGRGSTLPLIISGAFGLFRRETVDRQWLAVVRTKALWTVLPPDTGWGEMTRVGFSEPSRRLHLESVLRSMGRTTPATT